jgi:ABC-type polysaccharide/polyol phosphate transport system ATPase subunit
VARIEVERASVCFRVRPQGRVTFKEALFSRVLRRRPPPRIEVRALDGISLIVNEKDRLGVIGPNGAGKSTLLKMLAGIYRPSAGCCRTEGRVCSLFDISLGFEPDSSGWDNIRYRGYLQKETARSIRAKLSDIATFCELGAALDRPVRTYSSGMLVRLAFAIATSVDPEILLLDEVLGAGDLAFMTKARHRMRQLMGRARLLVLVSHDLTSLREWCDRVIWMEAGRIRQMGPPDKAIAAYRASVEGRLSEAA